MAQGNKKLLTSRRSEFRSRVRKVLFVRRPVNAVEKILFTAIPRSFDEQKIQQSKKFHNGKAAYWLLFDLIYNVVQPKRVFNT